MEEIYDEEGEGDKGWNKEREERNRAKREYGEIKNVKGGETMRQQEKKKG